MYAANPDSLRHALLDVPPNGTGEATVGQGFNVGSDFVFAFTFTAVFPVGIASSAAMGTAALASASHIDPSGIATHMAFGSVIVLGGGLIIDLSGDGISSSLAFGSAHIRNTIEPTGIASGAHVGHPTILAGIRPSGISSGALFGTARVVAAGTIEPAGIPSPQSLASPLYPGIGHPTIIGNQVIDLNLRHQGIVSRAAVGIPGKRNYSVTQDYPPTRLSISVETPGGYQTRWSANEFDPVKAHQALTFSTTMPGGFENLSCTLTRDPRRQYPDLEELSKLRVRSVGGSTIWEGRLETEGNVSGDQVAITPGAVGYQAALTDNNGVRELYVEIDMSVWQGSDLSRKLQLQKLGIDIDDGGAATDASGNPAFETGMTGGWARSRRVEGWYDTRGIPIGKLLYAWEMSYQPAGGGGVVQQIGDDPSAFGGGFDWEAFLSTIDAPVTSGADYNTTGNLYTGSTATGSGSITPQAGYERTFATVALGYSGNFGNSGVLYALYWTILALYGTQNLPLYTSLDGTQGLLGSDVLTHAIQKYAPELQVTSRGQNTITPSAFVIPQLTFLSPTTLSAIVDAVTAFEMQDWAVWEGPCFWWYPRNTLGKKWRARVGPAQLQGAGPQIDRLWNGVIVSFTDPTGLSWTAGPPGSGCMIEDSRLVDSDPTNPLNQLGIKKYAPLQMSTVGIDASTPPTSQVAIQNGAKFLEQQAVLNQSGSCTLNGYVEDEHGVLWPSYMPRAGDQIAFIDALDHSYRRIVSTSYNDDTRVNTLQLDTPPDTIQASLARLNILLTPILGA